tara:strand:- start:347 stop:505 length:159 start_codon:yes stop_codon:yes gene_type:complete
MIFLSYPPVYFLPNTWQSPGVDYPFPLLPFICAIIGLGISTWFISTNKRKWD